MLLGSLTRREIGEDRACLLRQRLQREQCRSLEASALELEPFHRSPVTCLAIDPAEERYLLSGGGDASVACYDLEDGPERRRAAQRGRGAPRAKPLFTLDKRHAGMHKYSVTGVQWWPSDTGMFVTGSFDEYVKVWDTNALQVATAFKMPGKVYSVALSGAPGAAHALVAAATEDPRVRLCDIAAGAATIMLAGHRERRRGALATLDPHASAWPAPRPARPRPRPGPAAPALHCPRPGAWRCGGARGASAGRGRGGEGAGRARKYAAFQAEAEEEARGEGRAHEGAANALCFTPDGLHLLSSGLDGRVRLWALGSGRGRVKHALVNYAGTWNAQGAGAAFCVSHDSRRLFHPVGPAGADVGCFDVQSGAAEGRPLRGHFRHVSACVAHPSRAEVYSAGADRQMLVWAGPPRGGLGPAHEPGSPGSDQDRWSDDEAPH
eukprot:tig00000144_g9038.t1